MAAATQPVTNGVVNNAPVPMEEEKSDVLTEAIEKIIIACEGRNDSRSNVFEAPSDKKNDAAIDRSGGGSLRSQELAQLSRLCTAASSPTMSIHAERLDFGVVDGEVLASLFQLLEEHVRSAAKVDLVGEACQALEPRKSENESLEETNMTVEKVSPMTTHEYQNCRRRGSVLQLFLVHSSISLLTHMHLCDYSLSSYKSG